MVFSVPLSRKLRVSCGLKCGQKWTTSSLCSWVHLSFLGSQECAERYTVHLRYPRLSSWLWREPVRISPVLCYRGMRRKRSWQWRIDFILEENIMGCLGWENRAASQHGLNHHLVTRRGNYLCCVGRRTDLLADCFDGYYNAVAP